MARQKQHWDPVLEWAQTALGARFLTGTGVMPLLQPEQALAAARAAIPREPWRLGAVHAVTTLTGSALLALALAHGAIGCEAAWTAAHVDEDWNMEFWGEDALALQRRAFRFAEMQAAARVLADVGGGNGVAEPIPRPECKSPHDKVWRAWLRKAARSAGFAERVFEADLRREPALDGDAKSGFREPAIIHDRLDCPCEPVAASRRSTSSNNSASTGTPAPAVIEKNIGRVDSCREHGPRRKPVRLHSLVNQPDVLAANEVRDDQAGGLVPTLHAEKREPGVAHRLQHARFVRFRRKPRRSRIAIDRGGPAGARSMDREVEDVFEFDDVVEDGSTDGKAKPARLIHKRHRATPGSRPPVDAGR